MKTKLKLLGCIAAMILTSFGARAFIIFQDNFPYAAGPLATNTTKWFAPPGSPQFATNVGISCDGAGSAVVSLSPSASVQAWSLFTNGVPGYSVTLAGPGTGSAITNWIGTAYYFPSNSPVAALYASFTINVSGNFTATSGDYIAMFLGTNFGLHPRVYVCTNTATAGFYRLSINNNSSPSPQTAAEIVPLDLSYGTTYNVVFKQVLATGLSTLWVGPANPANETITADSISPAAASSSVSLGGGITLTDTTGTNVASFSALCGFGFHGFTANGSGSVSVGSLVCGTTFADVVPASDGSNPPFITIPPANTTNFLGASATLKVVAGGDQDTITYQWYQGGTAIPGANSSAYTVASLALTDAGSYTVAVTNAAGGLVSSAANLAVISSSAIPGITTQPANATITLAGTANFSVVASDGGAPLTYQWYYGNNPITGQTNSALSLVNVAFSQAGNYSVHVSNLNGTTNSSAATLTVNPPATVSIAYLHSLVDTNFAVNNTTTLFTISGTVTTWTNMTTANNTEFYIQDATGGIAVFWSGAPGSTNLPPAGAIVQITAPMSQFDGLLEISPVFGSAFHSVAVLSTGNPLPVAKPLPFDPFITTNPAVMVKQLQGSYFVASNVFLDLTSGPTFSANANDPATNGYVNPQALSEFGYTPLNGTNKTLVATNTLTFTNQSGQTFVIFYNSHCDYIGQVKPTGPVTIYGVLGQFVTSSPFTSGYEFTPSRMADIIGPLGYTNVISNIIRYGDLAVNSYPENVLQPGETITITVSVIDPAGGTVTLAALPTSPASAGSPTWNITSNGGTRATATFTYTAVPGDAGVNLTNSLQYTLASGTFTANWTVYVPTADEQLVRISEVFANPTTDTSSPAYNPLKRGTVPETGNITVNDQYVEFVNASPDMLFMNHWTIGPASGTASVEFINGETLPTKTAAVIYGGPSSSDPNPPTIPGVVEAAYNSGPLNLSSGGGVVALHNNLGYLVDRVSYPAGAASVSFSRFPTLNGQLLPQNWINTNVTTAGFQYDGGSWSSPTTSPTGVSPVGITYNNGAAQLTFPALTTKASTLWQADNLTDHFLVVNGLTFPTISGTFTVSNSPAKPAQFYFITTQ